MDTAPFTRSVEPVARAGEPWSAAATRAVLKTLVGWARRSGPAPLAATTRAEEAQQTREYALQFSRTDPRFAADLCAAADRHERGDKA